MAKSERKLLTHHIDAAFDSTYEATDYQLIGADLTDFSVMLNPQVETKENILGENTVVHSGYNPSSSVSPFYHDPKKTLEAKIIELAMARKKGDQCKTSYVETLYQEAEDGSYEIVHCFREDILCIPTSYGGDVNGVQSPFDIYYTGNRTAGSFDKSTKKFTASDVAL